MRSTKDLLGRGVGLPLFPPATGRLAFAEGPEKVRQSIYIILDTEPGERLMRPAFGCGLRRYLMKPNNTATRTLIQRDVERALSAFEPRIALGRVEVEPGEDPALVLIHIEYQHLRTGRKDNLVYPFYLE
jgi:phage baseplate assembly protein W